MTPLLRSELLKLRTTRTMLWVAVSMLALIVLVTLVGGLVPAADTLAQRKDQFQLLANGSIAAAFAAIAGVLATTTEFRHGTIRPTLITSPRRTDVLVAKLFASTIAGVVFGVVGIGVSFGLGKLALSTRNIPNALSGRDVALVLGGAVAAAALWGAFGAGVGAALRNQVGSIVGLLVWVLFVESILFALVPSVGRYLPATAANALTQIETPHQLSVLAGTLVFLAYVLGAAVAGALVTERRDVS